MKWSETVSSLKQLNQTQPDDSTKQEVKQKAQTLAETLQIISWAMKETSDTVKRETETNELLLKEFQATVRESLKALRLATDEAEPRRYRHR